MRHPLNPIRVIEDGYDRLDLTYREWVERGLGGHRSKFLREVVSRIPAGASVLEIGCGPGTDAPALAQGRKYTGIDISKVQLGHAMKAVPEGRFLHGDVLEVTFDAASFDAVVSFYVFNHIPADRLESLLHRIATWLAPNGLLCSSFGTSDNPGTVQPGWLGKADMYFSSVPPDRTETFLVEAGLDVETSEIVSEVEEGEGRATFQWVIARKSNVET